MIEDDDTVRLTAIPSGPCGCIAQGTLPPESLRARAARNRLDNAARRYAAGEWSFDALARAADAYVALKETP